MQVNVSMPEVMYKRAKRQAKEEGYRSVQEYLLQALRDKWFLERLPHYERIADELEQGKGTTTDIEDFLAWSRSLRKSAGK